MDDGAVRLPRLLILASTYPRWANDPEPGFVRELARRLAKDFDVIVLGPHAPGAAAREHADGVEVIRYRYAPARLETLVNDGGIVTNLKRSKWKVLLVPGFVVMQAWRARRIVRSREIDVVHAHWLLPQGLVAALLRPVPFVVTSHGADLYALRGRLFSRLKHFVLERSSAATVVSSAMRETLCAAGAPAAKVSVLSMGVDVSSRFMPDPSVQRSSDEILFVGRLVEKKGVRHLIRAMADVLDGHPAAHITIAGFGPEEAALQAEAVRAGVAGKIAFLGALPQAELPALYRRAAVFVAPFVQAGSGDQEGLPVALMEAMACGCPVIAGRVAGLDDLLGEHADEIAVDARNEALLAKRILETLTSPVTARERALEMGAYVRERFDWDRIAGAYAALLKDAMRRDRHG
jgi:glycosyltransferase involved in cell wall biosynthesis